MTDSTSKPRILAVDDSRVMRRAMAKILSSDYDVIEAENGEDAWSLLINDEDISVVFTDLNMPYLDGFALLERIRHADDSHIRQVPVIIITGKDDDDDTKQKVLDMGASDFITKPFDSVQLKARAKSHIQHKQTAHQLNETSDRLEKQAAVDQATGLGGQKYFCKAADETIAYVKRHGGGIVLVRMDIDNFNRIFIKHGKEVADHVLHVTGDRLSQNVRQEDTVARIGLSKFAMLLRNTPLQDAKILVERIHQDIKTANFSRYDAEMSLTVSFGIYEPKIEQEHDIYSLLRIAEEQIQQAIACGGNTLSARSDLADDTTSQPAGHPEATSGHLPGTSEIMSLENMLEMLHKGQEQELLPYVDSLLESVKPVIDFLARHDREKLRAFLASLAG